MFQKKFSKDKLQCLEMCVYMVKTKGKLHPNGKGKFYYNRKGGFIIMIRLIVPFRR